MRRINYPENLRLFKKDYLVSVYKGDIKEMQRRWKDLRNSNLFLKNNFPKRLVKIILADYSKLIILYETYIRLSSNLEDILSEIINIFNYKKYQPLIANFFMLNSAKLDITTCFYCETSFINAYEVDNYEKECLVKLNCLPFDKLKATLQTKNDDSVRAIMASRPYLSVDEFNNKWKSLKWSRKAKKFESIFKPNPLRNHFDIDHVLDKGSCPLVSLSIMNFVPCCQVCNEKLKRSLVLGDYLLGKPKEHLSPSSPNYDFDNKVILRLEPVLPKADEITSIDPAYAIDFPEKFNLKFDFVDQTYEWIADIFRLRERYNFHKLEGLYWLSMKAKYNDSSVEMMSNALSDPNFSVTRIKEDIFRENYDKKRHPCFLKLKKDILNIE